MSLDHSVAAHSDNGSEPPLLLTASAAFSSARQEARTDLDLASQKIYKSSGPLQKPSAPPLVGSGPDPDTQIAERRGDVRKISLRLFLRQVDGNS